MVRTEEEFRTTSLHSPIAAFAKKSYSMLLVPATTLAHGAFKKHMYKANFERSAKYKTPLRAHPRHERDRDP